jgi:hypothetical protein
MLTWYRVTPGWPECGPAPGSAETQSGGGCSGFFDVFCRRAAFPGCGGSIGGDVEQRAIHSEFVCGMTTDIDVVAGADQQGTGPVWVAGAAHRGGDGPAGVSQGRGSFPACAACRARSAVIQASGSSLGLTAKSAASTKASASSVLASACSLLAAQSLVARAMAMSRGRVAGRRS